MIVGSFSAFLVAAQIVPNRIQEVNSQLECVPLVDSSAIHSHRGPEPGPGAHRLLASPTSG